MYWTGGSQTFRRNWQSHLWITPYSMPYHLPAVGAACVAKAATLPLLEKYVWTSQSGAMCVFFKFIT